jgi:hypothetical protein
LGTLAFRVAVAMTFRVGGIVATVYWDYTVRQVIMVLKNEPQNPNLKALSSEEFWFQFHPESFKEFVAVLSGWAKYKPEDLK